MMQFFSNCDAYTLLSAKSAAIGDVVERQKMHAWFFFLYDFQLIVTHHLWYEQE